MADGNMYVLNPVFQAESFDEMVKPLALYAQAYKEQEAKIEDMTDKAAALEWIANQDPDSQTAALYRDMSDKIKGIRDDMMINGLLGGTRSRILGARRMYSANSAEITRRYEDMKKYQDRMEQLKDKDNSMIFSPESQNVSLDSFAGGKRPLIKAISGNEVMARGAAIGKRFTSLIFGDGVVGKEMGEQFWKVYQEQGMTDDALYNALVKIGKGDKYPMLSEIVNGVYKSFDGFAPQDQEDLKNKFMEGFYSGAVYNRTVDYKDNGEYMNKAQRESLALQKADSARQDMQLDLQGLAAGYRREGNQWVFDPEAAMYSAAMAQAKKSGSGSGSGSGNSGGSRVTQTPAMYMTGDMTKPDRAYVSNGQFLTKDGGNSVMKGLDVTFNYNPVAEKLEILHGKIPIAVYDINNDTLDDVDNVTTVIGDVGISHSAFKDIRKGKPRWKGHDEKLLLQLARIANQTAIANNGNYDVLYDYEASFDSDSSSWNNNNGSISFVPKELVMPSGNAAGNTYEQSPQLVGTDDLGDNP